MVKRDNVSYDEVYNYIVNHPQCNYKEIANALEVYPFIVSRMIDFLVGSGKIRTKFGCLTSSKQGG